MPPLRLPQKRRAKGRPPGGVRPGDRVRDYPTLTVRIPPETRSMLTALRSHMHLPLWQLIRHLTVCFIRDLPAAERRALTRQIKRAVRRHPKKTRPR